LRSPRQGPSSLLRGGGASDSVAANAARAGVPTPALQDLLDKVRNGTMQPTDMMAISGVPPALLPTMLGGFADQQSTLAPTVGSHTPIDVTSFSAGLVPIGENDFGPSGCSPAGCPPPELVEVSREEMVVDTDICGNPASWETIKARLKKNADNARKDWVERTGRTQATSQVLTPYVLSTSEMAAIYGALNERMSTRCPLFLRVDRVVNTLTWTFFNLWCPPPCCLKYTLTFETLEIVKAGMFEGRRDPVMGDYEIARYFVRPETRKVILRQYEDKGIQNPKLEVECM